MEDFESLFDNFATEMQNTAYKHIIETNKDYIDVDYCIKKLNKKFDEIMDKLNTEEKELFKDLQKSSESSLSFWNSDIDDEVWNDV